MVLKTDEPCTADYADAYLGLPAVGSALLHLNLQGHGLTQFPLIITQLVALEHLDARGIDFAELPIAITAPSRLTALILEPDVHIPEPLQLHELPCLDACALGDLSAFPSLCELQFNNCEVLLCASLMGVVWHASLATLGVFHARPALESALMVLQLSEALKRLGQASILELIL